MRIFIAGIMQGSIQDVAMHGQDYREVLRELLSKHFPESHVYDPLADHTSSLTYEEDEARSVFLKHNEYCREVDLLVAYVPEASMGTAIEMWEAYQSRAFVISITPLEHNWAIRFTSHLMYSTIDEFVEAVESGAVRESINAIGNETST